MTFQKTVFFKEEVMVFKYNDIYYMNIIAWCVKTPDRLFPCLFSFAYDKKKISQAPIRGPNRLQFIACLL